MVGGGAGGVEISMALNHRLKVERQASGKADTAKCHVSLLSQGLLLQGHTPAARRKLLRLAKVSCCYILLLPQNLCVKPAACKSSAMKIGVF